MKSYHIDDTLTITRYGNKLRFTVDRVAFDNFSDDDIADIMNHLIDPSVKPLDFRKDSANGLCELVLDVRSKQLSYNVFSKKGAPLLRGIIAFSTLLKLIVVLEHLLPKLCEDGN